MPRCAAAARRRLLLAARRLSRASRLCTSGGSSIRSASDGQNAAGRQPHHALFAVQVFSVLDDITLLEKACWIDNSPPFDSSALTIPGKPAWRTNHEHLAVVRAHLAARLGDELLADMFPRDAPGGLRTVIAENNHLSTIRAREKARVAQDAQRVAEPAADSS